MGGGSAGATTAVALGISDQDVFRDEISLTDDPTLATTHLDQTYEIKSIVDFWGSNTALDVHELIYGTHHFDSNDPPLFIAHGTEDPTVFFSEAEELVQLYDSTGVHVELNTLVGRGHGPWGATLDGKSLSDLSFDFLVEQQGLIVADCGNIIDQDGDGFSSDVDCNDNDPSINPNATEIPDNGIDENCDGLDQTTTLQPEVKCDSTYGVIVESDIIYAQPLLLDLYVPDNNSDNKPVFMFIHGGGFTGGTKTNPDFIRMGNYFASRGWVFASVDYRTTEELLGNNFTGIAPQEWIDFVLQNATTPNDAKTGIAMYAAQRDNKAALRWLMANADTYNINKDFVTVGGASAGAITTIALGISNQEDFRDEMSLTDDPTLATTNLDQTYEVQSLVDFWGSNAKLDLFEAVYGEERYDDQDPELFIIHGTEDPAVLFSEAEEMVQIYDSTGVHVELVTLEGRGHGPWDATVDGKSLFDLSFDFLVEQQGLIMSADCEDVDGEDADGDGFTNETDCNDNDPDIYPGATEICNNIDDNCDGQIDEGMALASYFLDADGDGFGDPAVFITDCAQPAGYVISSTDCDDSNPAINPMATDLPDNGIDEDCNGADATDFVDNDGDGFTNETDCNDNDPDIYPGATEICNDIDDNCDGQTDEGLALASYFLDADGDGFGDPAVFVTDCALPAGYVIASTDCDDSNPAINPMATDLPDNGIDEDCNGADATDFVDNDGDGFTNETDCNDNDPDIYPGATEICNDIDDNCDGQTDEDLTFITYFADEDSDGFGNPISFMESCEQSIAGFVTNAEDCDDTNPDVNPNQTEEPYNGKDDDCNPATLDDDLDQDGFALVDDCDDDNLNINPNADEIPNNGIDEDCDGMDLVSATHELADAIVNVYPNPAIDVINITIEGQLDYRTNLYTLEGKMINTSSNSNVLIVKGLQTGIYLLEIIDQNSGQKIIERIIIGN